MLDLGCIFYFANAWSICLLLGRHLPLLAGRRCLGRCIAVWRWYSWPYRTSWGAGLKFFRIQLQWATTYSSVLYFSSREARLTVSSSSIRFEASHGSQASYPSLSNSLWSSDFLTLSPTVCWCPVSSSFHPSLYLPSLNPPSHKSKQRPNKKPSRGKSVLTTWYSPGATYRAAWCGPEADQDTTPATASRRASRRSRQRATQQSATATTATATATGKDSGAGVDGYGCWAVVAGEVQKVPQASPCSKVFTWHWEISSQAFALFTCWGEMGWCGGGERESAHAVSEEVKVSVEVTSSCKAVVCVRLERWRMARWIPWMISQMLGCDITRGVANIRAVVSFWLRHDSFVVIS
jgi:hypothetical protein